MNGTEPAWDLYRTLLATLREGSLSGAARRLGLTQPTVARHVDELEEAIGAPLFLRSQRGLEPTDVAVGLRPLAETLEATIAALRRAASARGEAIEGHVRITASEVVGVEVLPPILAELRRAHPGLVVELALTDAVEDLLRREADIAVRMVEPVQESLVARRLPSIALGLYAHRRHLDRHGRPESFADLARHPTIGFDRETPMIRAALVRFPELGAIDFALRTDSNLAQLAAIRAGFGIGVCQVPIAARDPDLVRVLPGFEPMLDTWMVMHESLRRSPRCRVVFDALAEGLRRHAEGSGRV